MNEPRDVVARSHQKNDRLTARVYIVTGPKTIKVPSLRVAGPLKRKHVSAGLEITDRWTPSQIKLYS